MSKIAVLLATYNGEKFIEEQLNSLLNQTFDDFSCYIHDDGSTDKTVHILRNYENNYPDQFHILEYEKSGGAKNNFLSLLNKVDADYYMFCDQDDVWLPEKIDHTYNKMMKIESTQVPCAVFSDLCVVDQNLGIINSSYFNLMHRDPNKISLRELLTQNVAAGCTLMVNRTLKKYACSYENVDNITMHDWWCALIAAAIGSIGFVNDTLILYRQHDENQIGASKSKINWIREKTINIIKGRQLKESRKGIIEQKNMANELTKLPGLPQETRKFITELANIDELSKMKRMKFYLDNHLIKRDLKSIWKIFIV